LPLSRLKNMPNKRRPHKQNVPRGASRSLRNGSQGLPRSRHSASQAPAAHSVKDLLARSVPLLSQAADQSARQAFWGPWLETRLPHGMGARITAITERDGNLVVFADSPAWSARLRYALQELDAPIRQAQPDIKEISVRVLPRPQRSK
jgi:Dna[CI] antecedent, DciA